MNSNGKKVFVGLSGGVDSSVAALRLKRAGFDVVGVFIKVWHPDFLVCDWERERLDAMRVAAILDLPFLTFDAEDVYKQEVADYMIAEYKEGRTPNPDVMCNKHIKFGAFLDFARSHGAESIATGHYAQIRKDEGGHCRLFRGVDAAKDQSYFLWTLTEKQLQSILFPIGDSTKSAVRREAAAAGLPTARKHDSQGICFLGKIDLKEFLSHYVDTEPGDVLDEGGNIVGIHDGALYFTLGQRHGFTLHSHESMRVAHYVVAKDLIKNTITVAPSAQFVDREVIELSDLNEIRPITTSDGLEAQFRYQQQPFPVDLSVHEGQRAILKPLADVEMPSAGQSCVLYAADECVGGGIIT